MAVVGLVEASNKGSIEINNFLESKSNNNYVKVLHYPDSLAPGISDGIDTWDQTENFYQLNLSAIRAVVNGTNLWKNYLPEDTNSPSDLEFIYNGIISSGDEPNNWLTFTFGSSSFSDKQILFQSSLLPYSSVVDVRKAISQNSGVVPLIDLPTGTYTTSTPYGEGVLTIGTRKLADLSDNGEIDLEDFSMLAEDWDKPQGQYVGDITGEYGIPDGVVDMWDLREFMSEWLE